MNLRLIRRYRNRLSRTSGLLKNNPVVALGMTMPFVIVPTLSLRAGLLMSAFLAAATIPSAVLASLVGRKIPPLFSLPFYGAVSTGCVLLLRFCVSGQALLLEDLGVYVPLAAFNGMMLELALVHPRRRASDALHDAVMMCFGFLLVAAFLSALREFLGSGSLWGVPLTAPNRIRGLVLPFSGFILIGFLSALFRRVDSIIIGRMLRASRRTAKQGGDAV